MAKYIAILSGKGGTGKSTVTAGLTRGLAELGARVLAVDMDAGLRSLDMLFSLEDKLVFDLGDVLSGRCAFSAAAVPLGGAPSAPRVCCLPKAGMGVSDTARLLREQDGAFDYVLLDLPAGLSYSIPAAAAMADLAVAVTVPERLSVRQARAAADELLRMRPVPCRLVINKVSRETMRQSGFADLDEVMDTVGAGLFAVLPWDQEINRAPSQLALGIFRAMALRLSGRYVPLMLSKI